MKNRTIKEASTVFGAIQIVYGFSLSDFDGDCTLFALSASTIAH